jgi:hypothetical protein
MTTRVVNCCREPYDVLIDRTTPLGNSFVIGQHGNREQVTARYWRYIVHRQDLMAMLPALRGLRLGCHCAPLPCHGDVLARLADATRFLLPGTACTAWWYALRAGLLCGGGDAGFLAALTGHAIAVAGHADVAPGWAPEILRAVTALPEWAWCIAADTIAQHAAEHGDYGSPEDTVQAVTRLWPWPTRSGLPTRGGSKPGTCSTRSSLRSPGGAA